MKIKLQMKSDGFEFIDKKKTSNMWQMFLHKERNYESIWEP